MTTSPTAAIVVGVDGSPQSMHAVDCATREAVARRCPLHIVHAFLWPLLNVPVGPPAGGPPDAGCGTPLTRVVDGTLVKVMAWYDNEWGFTQQMVREACILGAFGT
jgi:nucleotide-binding universal stress UspA family protein